VIDKGAFGSWVPPVDDVDRLDEVKRAIPVNLENFCGGRILCDREHDLDALGGPFREHIPRLVILTGSAPKARASIVGMYRGAVALRSNSLVKAAEPRRDFFMVA